jgi:hypothetical protein
MKLCDVILFSGAACGRFAEGRIRLKAMNFFPKSLFIIQPRSFMVFISVMD